MLFDPTDRMTAIIRNIEDRFLLLAGEEGDEGGGGDDKGEGADGKGDEGAAGKGDKDNDGAGGADGADGAGGGDDWRAALPDDLKKVAEKFTNPGDAVKSYSELQKRLGKSVVVPGAKASDDDWKAFDKALGVPDEPTGYKVARNENLPEAYRVEGEDAQMTAFLTRMKAAHAPPAIVAEAIAAYDDMLIEAVAFQEAAKVKARAEGEALLQKEWGGDYEQNTKYAGLAVRTFGGEELVEAFEKNGIADDPVIMRAFAKIGRQVGEDGLLNSGMDADGAKDLQSQIDDLQKKRNEAQDKGNHEEYARLTHEQSALYDKLHGTAPADGRAA